MAVNCLLGDLEVAAAEGALEKGHDDKLRELLGRRPASYTGELLRGGLLRLVSVESHRNRH
ncbi:hypothetical protein N8642_02150 [bacterium]|nr:hypothetical protein [bacterium]